MVCCKIKIRRDKVKGLVLTSFPVVSTAKEAYKAGIPDLVLWSPRNSLFSQVFCKADPCKQFCPSVIQLFCYSLIINFDKIKSLLAVSRRNHSGSKGLANKTREQKTKPARLRRGAGSAAAADKGEGGTRPARCRACAVEGPQVQSRWERKDRPGSAIPGKKSCPATPQLCGLERVA
jgi:hypothetical protein